MAEPPFDLASANRWFGIELNNRIMDALEAGRVTPETAESLIHAAHASCHHWMQAGTAAHHGRGEFAVASVYAAVGHGEAALRHARRCLELVEAHPGEMADWDLAFAYDALARAHAAAGEVDAALRTREQAKAAGEAISDDEDRVYFMGWFEGGSWHGLQQRNGAD